MANVTQYTQGNTLDTNQPIGELVYVGDNTGGKLRVYVEPNKFVDVGGSSSKKYCTAWKSASTTNGIQVIDTYDTNDTGMSVTSGRVTITKTGRYHLVGSLDCRSPGGTETTGAIYVNGSQFVASTIVLYYSASTDRRVITVQKYANLNAGDYVQLYGDSPFGGNVGVGEQLTFLQVQEV